MRNQNFSTTRLTTREILSATPNSVHGNPAAGGFAHPPHHGGIPLDPLTEFLPCEYVPEAEALYGRDQR
jgi:hypothetical protein